MNIEEIIEAAAERGAARALAQFQPMAGSDKPVTMSLKEAAVEAGVTYSCVNNWSHIQGINWCLAVGRKRVVLRQRFLDWLALQAEAREGTA